MHSLSGQSMDRNLLCQGERFSDRERFQCKEGNCRDTTVHSSRQPIMPEDMPPHSCDMVLCPSRH